MIRCKRKPGAPWSRRSKDSRAWNKVIGAVKLLFTLIPAIKTMVTCNHAWQFETIAAMKLALSLTSGFVVIFPSAWWALLYLPGVIAGTAGTISLASSNFTGKMSTITAVFGGVGLAFCIATVMIFWCRNKYETERAFAKGILKACLLACLVFGALYSDWVLAIVADNLTGYPFGQSKLVQGLWILYMTGKRLNLLSQATG
ncbi:hypothetical protein NHQ30_006732 [Ciborinia camelliae]|nr:hypothetical protein NHQ30_006732 [Ciborinia camelliae]